MLGRIEDYSRNKLDGRLYYRVWVVPDRTKQPICLNIRNDDLRAADKCCDGCNRWLPRSSFYGGSQYNNPIDGVVEVEYCFLCTRESRRYSQW